MSFDPVCKFGIFQCYMDDPVYVRIRLSAHQARYIRERRWEDGAVISSNTSGWWDVKRWVLSFGCEAEVLEPADLLEEMLSEIQTMEGKYNVTVE